MKTTKKIAVGISFAALVGLIIYWSRNSKKDREMREQVAEHGYETAQDILFPRKNKRKKHDFGQTF